MGFSKQYAPGGASKTHWFQTSIGITNASMSLPENNHLVVIVVFKTRLNEHGKYVPNNFVVTGWAKYIRPTGSCGPPPNKRLQRPRSARTNRRFHALSVGAVAKVVSRNRPAAQPNRYCPNNVSVTEISRHYFVIN
jgi:hypothetical protein